MSDDVIRAAAAKQPVPELGPLPFAGPVDPRTARVAIVTTAALHPPGERPPGPGDPSFRVLETMDDLVLGHLSPSFDRAGWLADPNVVFPLDRLHELEKAGAIGGVAPRHIAFAGNQPNETLATIGLDTGPAAAAVLAADGVDVVILTPV